MGNRPGNHLTKPDSHSGQDVGYRQQADDCDAGPDHHLACRLEPDEFIPASQPVICECGDRVRSQLQEGKHGGNTRNFQNAGDDHDSQQNPESGNIPGGANRAKLSQCLEHWP